MTSPTTGELVARLRGIADNTDRAAHAEWCRRDPTVPIHGYSGEGRVMREAAEAITTLERELEEARATLIGISNGWKQQYDGERQRGNAWMADAKASQAEVERLSTALKIATPLLSQYADFIRRVPAANIEEHPYLPSVEEAIEIAHTALSDNDRERMG